MNFSDNTITLNKRMKLANIVRCKEQESENVVTPECNVSQNFCMNVNKQTPLPDFDHADLSWSSEIDLSHLEPELKIKISKFLESYKDIFASSVLDLPGCDTLPHEIKLIDDKPVKSKVYRVPFHLRKEMEDQLDLLLKAKILLPSKSEYASPVILVKKACGGFRLACDFRQLNLKLAKDAYPIPNLNDSVDALSGSHYFSSVDLTSGFFQQRIRPEDMHKTAIITHKGLFHWSRNCFGMSNSSNSFQRLMNYIFGDLNNEGILCYIDDIIICSKTVDSHLEKLTTVFNRLRQHNLRLKPSKCKFLSKNIVYLGFEIESGKVYPINRNISTIENFKVPNSRKTVRSFLGCISFYRKFIPDFSLRARNLINLTKDTGKFEWTVEAQLEFEDLKTALISKPCLTLPDFSKEFQLYTDASGEALGAVLTQLDENNFPHPVAFASRKLKSPECSYSTTEREILAIVWATSHFKCYLANKHFTIFTDHAPLKYMLKIKDPTSRMARWICTLSDFNFTTQYISGKCNSVADFLSRFIEDPDIGESIPNEQNFAIQTSNIPTSFQPDNELFNKIKCMQKDDPKCCKIAQKIANNNVISPNYLKFKFNDDVLICEDTRVKGIIGNPIKLVVPLALVPQIFNLTHESLAACHQGFKKTIDRIRENFYWPGMYTHVRNLVDSCVSCQQRRAHRSNQLAPLQRMPTPDSPMSTIHVDCLGPFPTSLSGNKYIVTYIDAFTKWPEAYAVPSIEANKIAETFADFMCRYGTPSLIITDQGRNLIAEALKLIYDKLGVKRIVTTAYHAASNGKCERAHRTLVNALCHIVNEFHTNWDDQLKFALLAMRSSVHASTNFTPAAILYGRNLHLPYSIFQQPPTFSYNDAPSYCELLIPSLQLVYAQVTQNLIKVAEQQEKHREKSAVVKDIKVGDNVWLFTPAIKINQCKKLTKCNSGPYTVIKKINDVNFTIALNNNLTKIQTVHIDRLTKVTERMQFPDVNKPAEVDELSGVANTENKTPNISTADDSRYEKPGRSHRRRGFVPVGRKVETGNGESDRAQCDSVPTTQTTTNQPVTQDVNNKQISEHNSRAQLNTQTFNNRYDLRKVAARRNR